MKDKNQLIRLIVILGIGIFLMYQVYQFKFSFFVFDGIIFGTIAFFGSTYWIWAVYKDIRAYKSTKNSRFLMIPSIGIAFIAVIAGLNWKNNAEFNKQTLVRAYYDGDFNGTSIDFKEDGTYIFDNQAIGFSTYVYGNYKINGQSIRLERSEIDNVIKTDLLEIKNIVENGIDHLAGTYIFQIEPNGNELKLATKFRVVEDNRKK
ncbi:hypothetical protein KORDIASMS9_01294 [Kordia sp. SMS9]|nr:hypothetical protein KORDIASMS9_01294 [Kordia sp. SMS9]